MSSDSLGDDVDQPTRDKLEATQRRLAAANSEIADALDQSTGLPTSQHPQLELRNTHDELVDAYRELTQAIDMAERVLDDLEDSRSTPYRIKKDHADRLKETYDEPLLYLALQLLEANRRKWMHGRPETNGAREVERHGLTTNQRAWLNELDARTVDGE
jgi:cytochrome c biogenesis protein ResB